MKTNKSNQQNFIESICNPKQGDIAVIAEIKLQSPAAGKLGNMADIERKAIAYEKSFADAVSVVTESKYFGGEANMVAKIKKQINIPILQKDFIISPSQVYEAKNNKADALLLIAKLYKNGQVEKYINLCNSFDIVPVVEVYDEQDIIQIKDARVVGVNARNLKDFSVNIEKACKLIKKLSKDYIVIGFSGVKSRSEVEMYKRAGAYAVLVGTNLMRSKNEYQFIRSLKGL